LPEHGITKLENRTDGHLFTGTGRLSRPILSTARLPRCGRVEQAQQLEFFLCRQERSLE
jgi:hypothetical protein